MSVSKHLQTGLRGCKKAALILAMMEMNDKNQKTFLFFSKCQYQFHCGREIWKVCISWKYFLASYVKRILYYL